MFRLRTREHRMTSVPVVADVVDDVVVVAVAVVADAAGRYSVQA